MSFHQQLEELTGQRIPIYSLLQICRLFGLTPSKADQSMNRYSRVVPIRDLIAGADKPKGPLMLLVRDHREGFLVQLLEGLKKS